jgi:deazaflavin-dependent oxidoreductase (nitroreductase family)
MDQATNAPLPPSGGLALIRRVAGPLWLRAGFTAVLEVPGRRTGRPHHVSLFPIEVEGTTYLLSQYGVSEWVRNLRAAGRGELRRKGRMEAFTTIEVDGVERDRVIDAFFARTPKPFRRDFDRLPGAASHPTFRVEPIR